MLMYLLFVFAYALICVLQVFPAMAGRDAAERLWARLRCSGHAALRADTASHSCLSLSHQCAFITCYKCRYINPFDAETTFVHGSRP